MRLATWWQIIVLLQARTLAQSIIPTVCEEEACRCDSFTRIICNCTLDHSEVTLRPDGPYRVPSTATGIIIDNCDRLSFLSDTVKDLTQLRNIEIRNVAHIIINERALSWSPFDRESEMHPGIRITIHNSTIDELSSHAFTGRFDDIIISQSRIRSIKPFAFSSLINVKNIELRDNIISNIVPQAFKKFTTLNFLLRGGVIETLPSRFLSNVEVTNLFRIEGVAVKDLSSLTFLVNSPKRVLIESNNIETLHSDAFHIVATGPITFRNNTVNNLEKGAFYGITADRRVFSVAGLQELLIDNNTVTHLTPSSLVYNRTRLILRVDGLNLNTSCACELAEEWNSILKEQGGIISCWYDLEDHYVSIPTYTDLRCGAFKQTFWIYVVIGVVIVLLIMAVVIFFIVRGENEKKKKIQIVMSDGKTYRETELHIIVERAELLTTDL